MFNGGGSEAWDMGQQPSNRLEVLNISNVNALGSFVLNDERLLELLLQFPFLYAPTTTAFQDPDYEEWAWEQIAVKFNAGYCTNNATTLTQQPSTSPGLFSAEELKMRWEIIRPITKSLSKAYDIVQIPDSLRQVIVKLSVHLGDDQPVSMPIPKTISTTMSIILENIAMVESLPLAERKCLEAEMIELILASELDAKAVLGIDSVDTQRIDQEYEDFLKAIGLTELFVVLNPNADVDLISENTNSPRAVLSEEEIIQPHVPVVETEAPQPGGVKVKDEAVASEILLEPISPKRWIPIRYAHSYVRKCRVRVQRAQLEDYLPLAIIKRERKW